MVAWFLELSLILTSSYKDGWLRLNWWPFKWALVAPARLHGVMTNITVLIITAGKTSNLICIKITILLCTNLQFYPTSVRGRQPTARVLDGARERILHGILIHPIWMTIQSINHSIIYSLSWVLSEDCVQHRVSAIRSNNITISNGAILLLHILYSCN
jgi:hypothetical protein